MAKVTYSFFFGPGSAGNIRGKQIAEVLGAKQNPVSGFDKDVCIYVKVLPQDPHPKKCYVDIDDAPKALEYVMHHPEVGVIVNSVYSAMYISTILKRDDLHVIPHPHVNWENIVRPDRPIETVGIIGCRTSFMYPVEKFKKQLASMGMILLYNKDYWKYYGSVDGETEQERRQKVVAFHNSIDIQVVWRKRAFRGMMAVMKTPSKLVNAASFGIPTIAYPEPTYLREWRGDFIQVQSIDEMLRAIEHLKNHPEVYKKLADLARQHAQIYHIDKIVDLYRKLT